MKTQIFTYRDPQVEAAIFPADELEQARVESHFNGRIKGTSLHPSQRVLELRNIDGDEITASVGDWITKSVSGGVRVYEADTMAHVFEPGTGEPVVEVLNAPGTATGSGLDMIGRRYDLHRIKTTLATETDDSFRARIHKHISGQTVNNIIEKFGIERPITGSGPLAPMPEKAASDLAVAVAAQHQPPYFSEPFAPHPWVVAAIILASTAPQFRPAQHHPV